MFVAVDKFVTFDMDSYKYTIIAVDEYKTNTIASVNSIVCPEGFHYWMVFTLGYM